MSFKYILKSEIDGHLVNLYLTFKVAVRWFSRPAVPFYIPSAMYEGSNISIPLPTLVIIHCLLYSSRYDVVIHCLFDLHLPDD